MTFTTLSQDFVNTILRSRETLFPGSISTSNIGSIMATPLEKSKLDFLHAKIVHRYLENPSSEYEEIIMLADTRVTNLQQVYNRMGFQAHPVFSRESWLSEAAAKLTDEGYWAWAVKQVSAKTRYTLNGDVIHERVHPASIDATWPTLAGALASPGNPVEAFPPIQWTAGAGTPRASAAPGESILDDWPTEAYEE